MRFHQPFGVVTPSLDGEVLYVLARADAWFTAPMVTAKLGNRSVEGVRRVLARLVTEGVVERESTSHVPLYRFNKMHLAASAIVAIATQRDEFVRRLGAVFGEWSSPPAYAAIFGSAASGTMTSDKDIDLLIVRPEPAGAGWHDDVASLAAQASRWTGNDVRPLEYGERELRSVAEEPVLRDIAREGITVFGDRAWFRRMVDAQTVDGQ